MSHNDLADDLKKKIVQTMTNLQEAEVEKERKTITYVGEKIQPQIGIIQSQVRELMCEHEEDRRYLHEKLALLENNQVTLSAIENLKREILGLKESSSKVIVAERNKGYMYWQSSERRIQIESW